MFNLFNYYLNITDKYLYNLILKHAFFLPRPGKQKQLTNQRYLYDAFI
jgi:hypothetical protein